MQADRYRAPLISLFLILICLYFLPSFKNAFSLPKELLLYMAAALLVCVPLLQAALTGAATVSLKPGFLPPAMLVGLFLASLLYTPSPQAATGEILAWISLLVVFVSAAQLTGRDSAGISLSAVVAGALMGGIAILQRVSLDPLPLAGGEHRIYSTLGNPNHVGGFLALAIPAGAGLLVLPGGRGGKLRAVAAVALAVCCAALAVSRARGAMLSAWVGAVSLFAAVLWHRARPAKLAAACLIVLALGTAIAAGALMLRGAGHGKNSISWRLLTWRGVARMALERPILGWGAGSLNLKYLEFQGDVLDETDDPGMRRSATGILRMAHNEYLQLAAEEGFPAAILFVVLLAVCAAAAFRDGPESYGPGAVVVSAAVLSLTNFPLRLSSTAYPFFVFAGLCLTSQPTTATMDIRPRGFLKRFAIALIAAGLVALTAGYSAVRLRAESLFTRGVYHYYRGRPETALGFFRRALEKTPHDGVARLYAASCLSKMRRHEEAIREMRKSLETHVEMASLMELGNLMAVTGREEEAARVLRECARVLPEDPRPHFFLGYALFRKGDLRGAIGEYEEVLRLDADYPEAGKNLEMARAALAENATPKQRSEDSNQNAKRK